MNGRERRRKTTSEVDRASGRPIILSVLPLWAGLSSSRKRSQRRAKDNFTVDLPCLLLIIKTPAALPGSNYIMRVTSGQRCQRSQRERRKTIQFNKQIQQPCTTITLFSTFIYFLRPLYDHDVKLSYATFYGRWEHVARSKPFFFSLLELERFKRVRLKL